MPYADYFPRGVSLHVPKCEYSIDTDMDNRIHTLDFGAPLALDADGILNDVLMVNGSAVTVTAFTPGAGTATLIGFNGLVPFDSFTVFNGWGRNITAVASAANTRVMTVTGFDYLGQKLVENMTLAGAVPVIGLKAFAWITSISFASAADVTTVDVGWADKLGLPLAGEAMFAEIKNGALAANPGTFVAALADATPATAINADTRGTYLPLTVIPNGVVTFKVAYVKRSGNLHGNVAFAG